MRKPVVNLAASTRARLFAYAKAKGLAFDLVLTRFALERLLDRLSRSPHADRFVLKGGMLVMVWFDEPLRATRDLDLLGFGDPTPEALRATFAEILSIPADDALEFDHDGLTSTPIREADQYGGVRLRTTATLANARIPVVVDIAFGDAVEPGLLSIDYPVLLDLPPPKIRAYSPETVIAEKFQAMVALGRANSRMKDIFDVWSLFNAHEIDPVRMADALAATFARRNTLLPDVTPDGLTPAFGEDPSKIRQWRAFVDGLGSEPPPLVEVLATLTTHLMPLTERARALARPA
ncbi:MAG: nucleotidyl transferase AbiEii/AbiGii toxin family protein [Methylobacterium mesophilicum]|nr:nucleotidyl transferase AbiEii/AbiGii toxin family protein [Methylobacterium mesophilicum]